MMVGYNHDLGADVYRMWYQVANRVHRARDVIWLKKMNHKMKKQGAEIINSKPNVGNIEVEDAIDNTIGIEQE